MNAASGARAARTRLAPPYPSIGHLPGSRTGPRDRTVSAATARACTVAGAALPGTTVTVQEKLDGSCVMVARLDGRVVALGRDGARADDSPNAGRRMFARWVAAEAPRFDALLEDGERAAGEWLALVHGTRYALTHEPFVLFDLLSSSASERTVRKASPVVEARAREHGFSTPHVVHRGAPLSIAEARALLGDRGRHGADDRAEGVVYRVERADRVLIVAKLVEAAKIDGRFLPENTGAPALWNFHDGLDL